MSRDTNRALSEITDEGLFEALATAVLREAHPLCAGLVQPGINADGKTRKAPNDALTIVEEPQGPRLILVQHTITAPESLARKWLFDPTAAESRSKSSKPPTTPPGDLIKSASTVEKALQQRPQLRATLILTTNQEPGDELVCEVSAVAATRNIDVDIWSRERLAHFLDINPTGHWIRQFFLNIEAERLSPELLRALSRDSVRKLAPPDQQSTWVDRELDRTIASIRAPLTYLAADSGLGKTVACYRALAAHVAAGGFGLVLPHQLIETSTTLERAVGEALVQLHPKLDLGENPLGCCSPEAPLFIVVEDVNRSAKPQRLIERLAAWALPKNEEASSWRVICPVWPRSIGLVAEQVRRTIDAVTVHATKLSADESRRAVIRQIELAGQQISDFDADQIATALGHDPLLIGLHDYSRSASWPQVIGEFVEHALVRGERNDVLAADMHASLMSLTRAMLERCSLDPSWREVQAWGLEPACLSGIRAVAANGEVMRLGQAIEQHRLLFRHDRVRDWLLIESAAELDASSRLPDPVVAEPFYAEILGAVLVRRECQGLLLERLRTHNPLALMYALRLVGNQPCRSRIYASIADWLQTPELASAANETLRWHAVVALESVDGSDVPELVAQIPEKSSYRFLAALHNGDVDGGINACARYGFDSWYPFVDRQIEHVKLRFADSFVHGVREHLVRRELEIRRRRGLIELCGHLAEASLVDGLEAMWRDDADRASLLRSYLWAFARCCPDDTSAERNLGPICDAWAALPDRSQSEKRPSPRDSFVANGAERAFRRLLPSEASLNYFVARASDPHLRWPLTYLLNGIDHPIALRWVVQYAATEKQPAEDRIYVAHDLVDVWRRHRAAGPMSASCRALLQTIWTDRAGDPAMRQVAFAFWSTTLEASDVALLREHRDQNCLANAVLAQRLVRGDAEAVPDLVQRLRDEKQRYWWSWSHYVLTPAVIAEVERALVVRRERSQHTWLESFDGDHDICDLVCRMPVPDAERLLLAHWDHVRFASRFVQVALFLCTERLKDLARASISECPNPAEMIKFVAGRVWWAGHPGITREDQIKVLEPYLALLTEHDRDDLAQACNRNGWFDLRRRLFDAQITHPWIAWKPGAAPAEFDAMIEKQRAHWIGHEIEMALETGATWPEYLAALTAWFAERRSFAAFEMLAAAITRYGARADLSALQVYEGMPHDAAVAVIENTSFAVARRSLT